MKKDNSYRHIFKYTGLFGSVQGLNILIGLVRNKVMALLLGPHGVGLVTIYHTASTLMQNATGFGLQMSGVREISQAFETGDTSALHRLIALLRSWSLLAALLGFAVCLSLSDALSYWAFSSSEHTLHFALLSIVVAMAAITGGETAILKATRRLKQLATTSLFGVVAALVISIPLYVQWGYAGIIPSLLLIGLVQMALVMGYAYQFYPPRILTHWKDLRDGRPMITVGTAFVLAGVLGSGADFAIRAYLSGESVALTGLFNAGYMITMTYAGMVFAAMETDYFPRLSAVCHDPQQMNNTANRQMEVSLLMIAPLLVVLMFALRWLIPLLFSNEFLPVVGMTQLAVVAMLFRAFYLPIAYIMLAKGDSKSYLLMESFSDLLMVTAVIAGYHFRGLEGTGMGLLFAMAIDTLCVAFFCRWRYGLKLKASLLQYFLLQLILCAMALFTVRWTAGAAYWTTGFALCLFSTLLSWQMYKSALKMR